MFDSILNAFKALWDWIMNFIKDCINTVLEPLADLLPDLSYSLDGVADAMAFANSWVALDWAFSLLGLYFVFIITMIMIKLFVKLFIPTVG